MPILFRPRAPHSSWLALLVALVAIPALAGSRTDGPDSVALFMDQSLSPEPSALAAFDLCILRADARADLEAGQALGNRFLGQVDLLHLAEDSPAVAVAKTLGVPLLPPAGNPAVRRLDVTHPEWLTLVVHELVESAAEKNFDGFVLGGLDSVRNGLERAAVVEAIMAIDARFPDKQILLEGGFGFLREVRGAVDGMLFVGISGRSAGGKWRPNSEAEVAALEQQIRDVRRHGLAAYAVDFAQAGDSGGVSRLAERLRGLGAIPFITTASLAGVNLGPLLEITRRVAVLHSGPAAATWSAKVAHGPLEWLGGQVEYVEAASAGALHSLEHEANWAGVIIDPTLRLGLTEQKVLTEVVGALMAKRVPVLLAGMPWQTAETWLAAASLLNLHGSGAAALSGKDGTEPHASVRRDVRPPVGAKVLVSQPDAGSAGGRVVSQVFLAAWGAVWLDVSNADAAPSVDPFLVLEPWLARGEAAPVADTTTLNGRRILVSHVASDGFTATSSLPGMPMAAEVMRDRILKRYELPFTVAVCESEVRGWSPGLDPADAMRYEQVARSLFSLPQVEAATHSFSRPARWEGRSATGGALNEHVTDNRRGMEREVAGSMSYIHRHLLPAGKKVELMLWPAAPSREAVGFSRQVGVENLAMPIIEGAARVQPPLPPRTWGPHDAQQAIAAVPARAPGPLDAGAMIATLAAADAARRLTPVHVPLQFSDAQDEASLGAVEKVLDWCGTQPLHPVSAASHARMVRDASRTRVLQKSPGHWIIVNGGHARTLRLPASAGCPDLSRSRGVAGYVAHGGQLYIHTLGLGRVELVMKSRSAPLQLRLAAANGSVDFLNLAAGRALLQVAGHRPVELRFGGIQPGATCMVNANGQPAAAMADATGHIDFIAPPRAVIQLQVMPSDYAAMR